MAEVKRIGNLYGEDRGTGFAGNVWDKDGISPTITTMQGGGREPMIIDTINDEVSEKVIVAMRGRNPENPTDRTPGIHTEQRLEMNKDGLVNILTTVQKDNLLLESKTIRMVRTEEVKEKMKNIVIDIYNNKIIDDKVCGTITAHGNASSTTCGTFGIVEKEKINKVGQISNEGSQCGTVVSDEGLAHTLSAGTHGYANAHVYTRYRIRKLTPKECWRLMGYTDKDFEKAAKVNSNTQLYKQAGNAIVKQVLMAIFEKMIK